MKQVELQKWLQECGAGSRRTIREWITSGRLTVNGQEVRDPHFPVNGAADSISVDGRRLKLAPQQLSYFVLNKPVGVVSTLDDPQKRPTIRDFLRGIRERVYPVGRLDFHSEGLILLTNDGDLANFILSARNKVPKTYMMKIKGKLDARAKEKLERGIFMEGSRLAPFRIEYVKSTGAGNSWLRVTITEGKKHILRKAFLYSGYPVEKLRRVAIGSILLKKLPRGHWRELPPEEIAAFKKKYHYSAS